MTIEGPYEIHSWDSFPNDQGLPRLVSLNMTKKTGEKITVHPMNPENHTEKPPYVFNPALFYSLPYVIDNADNQSASVSNDPRAIANGQTGKTVVYYKKGLVDKLKLPDFAGQTVLNDITEVVVHYNEETGENYTQHYDIKFDNSDD